MNIREKSVIEVGKDFQVPAPMITYKRHFIKKEQTAPKCQLSTRRSLGKFVGLSNNRTVDCKFIYNVENKQVCTD